MTDLEHYFDVIERAAMTKAWEKGDERLAGEAAEARERIFEEFEKLRHHGSDLEIALKSQIDISNTLRGNLYNAEVKLAEYMRTCESFQEQAMQSAGESVAANTRIAELEADGERIREEFQRLETKLMNTDGDAACEIAKQRDRIAALESQLQAKHPCDETCPACWQLAKELTEAREKIQEMEKFIGNCGWIRKG